MTPSGRPKSYCKHWPNCAKFQNKQSFGKGLENLPHIIVEREDAHGKKCSVLGLDLPLNAAVGL
jgi:hypothetical protein